MSILVLNAGSSSLKLGLYDDGAAALASGSVDWGTDADQAEVRVRWLAGGEAKSSRRRVADVGAAVPAALDELRAADSQADPGGAARAIRAVGQRVVQGGETLLHSVRIDAPVKAELRRLVDLAPLHNPPALEAIAAIESALPGIPQVAVFDTSFYGTLDAVHHVYPVPYEWYSSWGVRRFGFHGISHAYCAARAADLLGGRSDLRVVSCHLGNGCSATASRGGVAVATTMGFTPLDGLMMGTRPGAIDPGLLIHVQKHRGLTVDALDVVLNHGAGLAGVSGVSRDYRAVEAAAALGHARARLALDIYALRVREAIGALATSLGGIDALVFTAGVGENGPALRASVCEPLAFMGVEIDPKRNAASAGDRDIAGARARVRVLVLHTEEELMIAREVRRVLAV
ncbi:MAG TPA: acetate/propionate family kinase, partial [Dehalococcoidia bacterium]|nr:acetate/propionate family kinase [Dehalococcoidia bacterium]